MADKKISALTSASTPLAGTEVLPIVQSGATVKVAVSDLTAGRAISATEITLTAGNVIPANGYGVDFSATAGTGTSELFADYEEGTWTPTAGGSSGQTGQAYAERSGRYTKIGRAVFVTFDVSLTTAGTISGDAQVSGLPFALPNVGDLSNSMGSLGLVLTTGGLYTWQGVAPQNNSSYFNVFVKTVAATSTSVPLGSTFFVNGTRLTGGGFYTV
jgi:hypothetical protein